MSNRATESTTWHIVKTRLRGEERDWLERIAQRDDRSIASILRRLVRDAKDADQA